MPYNLLFNKYYIDELYNLIVTRPMFWVSQNVLNRAIDSYVIDGAAKGAGLAVQTGRPSVTPRRNRQRPALRIHLPAGRVGRRSLLPIPGDGPMSGGLLTALIFLPLIGALFILMQSEERAIWNSAFIFSLLPLALSFYVLWQFDPQLADYQFARAVRLDSIIRHFIPHWYRRH